MEVARLSDVGLVRTHNEDRLLTEPSLIAVADGMGGAQAGEVAAEMAVQAISGLGSPVRVSRVRGAVEEANREIRRLAGSDSEKTGMGTTVTAVMLEGGRLAVVHVGDSRAYLWRDGELRQLTEDHSVVGELVRRGSLSPEEAETHPHRNVITRALGAEAEVQVDVVDEDPRAGDLVLVCSDGLSSYVSGVDIAHDLAEAEAEGLEAIARRLVDRANAAGGADNVTVVLARIGEATTDVGAEADGAGATREVPRSGAGATGDTAEIPVLGGLRGRARRGDEGARAATATRPPRLLQPVGRRRSRLRPALAIVALLAVIVAGSLAWAGSRTYVLAEGDADTVVVKQGLPVSLGTLELNSSWQDTGLSAEAVRAAEPEALETDWRGQGEAVLAATALALRHGLPEFPALQVAPTAPVIPAPDPAAPPAGTPAGDPAAPGLPAPLTPAP